MEQPIDVNATLDRMTKDEEEVVIFVAEFSEAGFKVAQDKKLGVSDMFHLKDAAVSFLPAYEGRENVNINFLENPGKKAHAVEVFADRFNIPQEKAEPLVERGVYLILENISYVRDVGAAIRPK
jgi:hypothetical protein